MISRQLIENAAQSAHELYGLVPKHERKKYADDHYRALLTVLTACDKLVGQMDEIECLARMARQNLEHTAHLTCDRQASV